MTNTIAPFGLEVFRRRDGGSPTMGQETFAIGSSDPTQIFRGDMVQSVLYTPLSGGSGSFITQASTGAGGGASPVAYRGVFNGCKYYNAAVGRTVWSEYWPGNAAAGTSSGTGDAEAYVIIDDELYFTVMGSSALIYGSSLIGLNVTVTANSSTGNTTSGISAVSLSTLAPATLSSYPLRIVGYLANESPPGGPSVINGTDMSTVAPIVIVAPNNWDVKNTTGI